MLIKSADDKSKRLALLEDLQKSPLLDRRQRDWRRDEQFRLKRGIAGERDAAHFLDNYLRDDPDRMLLHDLRFQVDGEVSVRPAPRGDGRNMQYVRFSPAGAPAGEVATAGDRS